MKYTLSLLILLIGLNAYSQNETPFDYGIVKDSVYVNTFFNFSTTLPKGWVVQKKELMDALRKQGEKILEGNENLSAAIKASQITTAYLLTAFEHEVGAPVPFNPSYTIIAENVELAPGIKTGGDYLYHAKQYLQKAGMQMDKEAYTTKIGNNTFDVLEVVMKTPGGTEVKQRYHVLISKRFAIAFLITYATDEQSAILEKALASILFNNG